MKQADARQWTRLRRRQLLAGGLGSLGLLSLPGLRTRGAVAQAPVPQRLLLVYSPNGTIQEQFWPTVGASETEFTLNQICAPLEAFKERLLFLKGLSLQIAQYGPGGPHQKGLGGLFTNSELQAGSFVDGDGSVSGWANGLSIDQAIAKTLRDVTPLGSLELGVRAVDNDVRGRLSYSAPGSPMTPMNSPFGAFERLFSTFGAVSPELEARRSRVIDVVAAQYATIAPQLSRIDQIKLQQHLALIGDVEQRMLLSRDQTCERPPAPPALAADDERTMPEIADQQVDLLSVAFACDLTRVASLQISTAINGIGAPWLNSPTAGHLLSHAGPTDTDATDQLIRRNRWVAEKVARLMTALDKIPEADGTVLDHTLIVWANELGEGSNHTHDNIPFALAGGGGGFAMGRVLEFNGVSHGRLLTSLGRAMGLNIEHFGSNNVASDPLTL
jgi:Protein of unknown function (DUF1552)